MPKIGISEVKAAYSLATQVARGKLTDLEAATELHNNHGMNFSSAWAYVRKRREMLAGERYTRTMNIAATRYFLEQILADEGQNGLTNALASVRRHAAYYSEQGKSSLPSIIGLVEEFEDALKSDDNTDGVVNWDESILKSYLLSEKARKRKLPPTGHKPHKTTVMTVQFVRNAHVVAARLHHAGGFCEDCGKAAPFLRKSNGLPFLEVHHNVTLAGGGEDTFENAIALCPNCHRRCHFG